MSMFLPFPIYAKFKYKVMTTQHVPKRGSKEFTEQFSRAVNVTLDEMVEFSADPSIHEWETVLVHLSLDEIRRMMAFEIMDMIVNAASNLSALAVLLRETFGIRITQKDLKAGMDRIRPRIRIELLKSHVFDKFMQFHQGYGGLNSDVKNLMGKKESTWADIENCINTEILPETSCDLEESKTNPNYLRKKYAVLTFYTLLFFHRDETVIERWLGELHAVADKNLELLENTLIPWVSAYLSAKSQSDVRKLVANLRTENHQDKYIEQLQRENQEQKDTIALLLSVIASLSPKHSNVPEPCRPQLNGEHILVIGDNRHMPAYRALVESRGGVFDFLEGFDKERQFDSKMESAEGILFVTAYSSHKKFYAMKAEKQFYKCVLVNQAGLGEFERGLEALIQRMHPVSS